MKLIEKNIITGTILLKTGLHIGGSKSSLDIGGLDSPVIKTPLGVPYIPGSSLKGKIRTLLGLSYGAFKLEEDKDITKKKTAGPKILALGPAAHCLYKRSLGLRAYFCKPHSRVRGRYPVSSRRTPC